MESGFEPQLQTCEFTPFLNWTTGEAVSLEHYQFTAISLLQQDFRLLAAGREVGTEGPKPEPQRKAPI